MQEDHALTTLLPFFNQNQPFVVGIDLGTTNSVMAIAGKFQPAAEIPLMSDRAGEFGIEDHSVPVHLLQLPQQNLDSTIAAHILFPSVVFQSDSQSPIIAGMGAREAKFHFRRGRNVFYSVKMDMGQDRLYPGAISEELNTPVKVSAEILRQMRQAAEVQLKTSLEDVPAVITIPACFGPSQRMDTLNAARAAGFKVDASALFDEPNAALLAYINRQRIQQRWNHEETVLVFDFGGGTCDISIIEVSYAPVRQVIHLRNLSISRFEQLGGDDLDRHLVHTLLKQQFYAASGIMEKDWSLAERQHSIWSQLAKLAELLKIRFCEELDRVAQYTQWNAEAMQQVQIAIPPQSIRTRNKEVILNDLSLDWYQFSEAIQPFIDPECSQNGDMEYYRITSIFSPIQDALDKAQLKKSEITRILLVGGSARNPLIEQAIHNYFPEAAIDRTNQLDYLVAEGAAVHAYTHFIQGHDILAPILGDTIGILVEGKEFEPLIPAGSLIPFPEVGWKSYTHFRVPRQNMTHVDLMICAGSASRPVQVVQLAFDRPIPQDTPVNLDLRMDHNKILFLQAHLQSYPDVKVNAAIENPLGLLPMTSKQRERAELERGLQKAQAEGTLDQHIDDMEQLADVLIDLNRSELALEWINQAIRRQGEASFGLKILKAVAHMRLGENDAAHPIWVELLALNPTDFYLALRAGDTAPDFLSQEMYYRQAVKIAPNNGIPQFYLACNLVNQGNFDGARESFKKARDLLEAQVEFQPNARNLLLYLAATYDALGMEAKATSMQARAKNLAIDSDLSDIDDSHLVGRGYPLQLRGFEQEE